MKHTVLPDNIILAADFVGRCTGTEFVPIIYSIQFSLRLIILRVVELLFSGFEEVMMREQNEIIALEHIPTENIVEAVELTYDRDSSRVSDGLEPLMQDMCQFHRLQIQELFLNWSFQQYLSENELAHLVA